MSETKFGVLASLCYMLAFVSAAAAVVVTVTRVAVLPIDTGGYVAAAIALAFWGFVFHAFHTSTLRRDALLAAILDALMRDGGTRAAVATTPKEAWLIGERKKR
jgi:alpha-D-ribose 1-methylphosphonate 5-triphosphate synthase subunit PhnG